MAATLTAEAPHLCLTAAVRVWPGGPSVALAGIGSMRPSCCATPSVQRSSPSSHRVAFDLERAAPGGDFPPPCVGDAAATRWMRRVPGRHRLVHSRSTPMSILSMVLMLLAQAAEPARERVVPTGTGGRPRRQAGRRGGGRPGRRRIVADPYDQFPVAVPRPPAVLATRCADADGRFRVELPERGEVRQDPRRRPGFLWRSARGGPWRCGRSPTTGRRTAIPIRLALARPGPVEFSASTRTNGPSRRPGWPRRGSVA